MGLRIISLIILLITIHTSGLAQYRVVSDPQTTAVVIANTAAQTAIESQHNKRLDSIRSKQEKIEMYTLSMATINELHKVTLENIGGFGEESAYYVQIGQCAMDIAKDMPTLLQTVWKSKWPNKVLCISELMDLSVLTKKLVSDFILIVNNGKIKSPIRTGFEGDGNDGYNFLDRDQRLSMANTILTDLMEIRYKVMGMIMMAQYATMQDLFFAIDPEGWANVMVMTNAVDGLIRDWNGTIGETWDNVIIDDSKFDFIYRPL